MARGGGAGMMDLGDGQRTDKDNTSGCGDDLTPAPAEEQSRLFYCPLEQHESDHMAAEKEGAKFQ